MRSIQNIVQVKGKRVLVRLDLNVSVRNGTVTNDFRIRQSMPTIKLLKKHGARLILLSHIDEKEGGTLEPVAKCLAEHVAVTFVGLCLSEEAETHISEMQDGDVVLCENLRSYEGEEKNDSAFANTLAEHGDLYVNDAFAVSHRKHASIVALPKLLPGYGGVRFVEEVKHLSTAFDPPHPFLLIIGGAKFETKMPLIEKFLKTADRVFVGGALANDFFKEKGYNTGRSLLSGKDFNTALLLENNKLMLPIDVEVKNEQGIFVRQLDEVRDEDAILDVGPETMERLQELIHKAKFILWNGPLGNYEVGFRQHTAELGSMIATSEARSIIGGGDTFTAIAELGIEDEFTFVSTAGGAMIQFLSDGTLPGIEALEKSQAG